MTEAIRVLNQTTLLSAYGFRNGQFDAQSELIDDIDFMLQSSCGQIEGAPDIDSALEFITAARYGRIRVSPANQRIIDGILPPGPEGDKILAAAWLEKLSRDNTTTEACNRALAFISGRSHISVAALRSHYQQTMRSRLIAAARDKFNFPAGTSDETVINTVIDLYSYVATFDGRGNLRVNDQALFNDLIETLRTHYINNNRVYSSYMQTIYAVDISLNERVHRCVSRNSISVMSPLNNNGRIVAQDIRAGR